MRQLSKLSEILLLSLVVLIILYSFANSQWYYSMYLEQEYNSNPFGLPEAEEDHISQLSMGLRKDWDKVTMQYYGSYFNFKQFAIRNFYWHQFYLAYSGETTTWSFIAENRIDKSDYNIYDYVTIRGGFSHLLTSEKFLWRLNGGMAMNTFHNFSELNNVLMSASTSLNRSFPTRTSLIASAALNVKTYLDRQTAIVPPDDTLMVTESINSLAASYYGGGGGGMGPGHGGDGGQSGYYYYSPESENTLVSQIFLSLRLAQSITKFTGIALQFQNRTNLNKYDRSVSGLYGYLAESQIFDDPMGYQGNSLGAELTQLFPWQISLKSAAYYQQKNYVSQGIYLDEENFDQTVLRKDQYKRFWILLEKQFPLGSSDYASLNLQLNYQWIENISNSYWYNFKSQYISIGLQLDL